MYISRISLIELFILGALVGLLLSGVAFMVLSYRMRRITDRYEQEVQRTKDELLALASHQLRTPASAVKQYLGILTSGITGRLTREQRTIALKAHEANERQIEIINEMLYVSKADAGQLVLEPSRVNLTRIVQHSIDGLMEQAAEKAITLSFHATRPRMITADGRYIAMIVDNLVSNAVKYSYPSSVVKISVRLTAHEALISVRDNGVGVAAHDREKIFEKFTRVENPLSHEEDGSGLGLFLARQLARAHGGDITVDSRLEKGSRFTLSIPVELMIDERIVHLGTLRRMTRSAKVFANR